MLNTIRRAAAYREAIRNAGTDAFRIVDGASDKLPGIEIDEFAGHWLVQTREKRPFPDALAAANPAGAIYWKSPTESRAPLHISGPVLNEPFTVREVGLSFWIDFNSGASQGLFIDQRDNRQRLRGLPRIGEVLNCFAYTCAFGVAAAAQGAPTTNIDLSKNYLAWGRRNYELNSLDPSTHEFLHGDVFDWLGRFQKKGAPVRLHRPRCPHVLAGCRRESLSRGDRLSGTCAARRESFERGGNSFLQHQSAQP